MVYGKKIRKAGARAAVIAIALTVIAVRAPEWTKGIDSEFIVYGQTSSLPFPTATTKVMPQIVVGSFDGNVTKYKSVIQVVNEGATAATVSGNFYNEDGTPSTLVLKTNLSTLPTATGKFASVTLPSNGVLILTADTAAAFTVNWARIVSTGGTVSLSAYFDFTDGSGRQLYSRVGVAASDANLSRFTIPRVRNVDTGLDVGFALVNTGTTSATISGTLKSSAGSTLATKSITLGAGDHTATFAREFFALKDEAAGTNYSFIVFDSQSAQFAATALAIEGGSLSSFPVSTPGSTGTASNAEVTDGSVTTVKLANASVTADKIAAGAVVKSLNSLKDDVTLTAGANVTITTSNNSLVIATSGQPGPAGPTGLPGGQVILEYTGQPVNWTVPAGVTKIWVDAWAGGGGGGYAGLGQIGAGGGGGGYAQRLIPVTPGATYTISVGGGGASAYFAGTGGGAGGGATTLSSPDGTQLVIAGGGGGGAGSQAGTAGGAATGGTTGPGAGGRINSNGVPGGGLGGKFGGSASGGGSAGGTGTNGGVGGPAGDGAGGGGAGGTNSTIGGGGGGFIGGISGHTITNDGSTGPVPADSGKGGNGLLRITY